MATITSDDLMKEFFRSKEVIYSPGTTIFKEGSKADCCYLIIQGKVQITKKAKRGGNIQLAKVTAGEFLGEMAMLSGAKRSASAVALTSVKVIVIEYDEFEMLLKKEHPFAARLSFHLAHVLAARCQRLLRLIAHPPKVVPMGGKKIPSDVSVALNRVYTLWAV
ncbi:MAG TPA: cyclic nucleotide-binding domain-containing protein [Candidatus Methylacidiphilales bacterium]|nr:cyclic nucleotide-binding domain-containing protein [Candidatus Methylacidiphilales bacterium]